MDSPKVTVAELLDENCRLRAAHEKELAALENDCAALRATLRDQFAGQAMAALIVSPWEPDASGHQEKCAQWAYAQADAMLAARQAESKRSLEGAMCDDRR